MIESIAPLAAALGLLWLIWKQSQIIAQLKALSDIQKQRAALVEWLNVAQDEEEERLRR